MMSTYFSPATRGFYCTDIHGDQIPADAVTITMAEYTDLLAGQAQGLQIVLGQDGRPALNLEPETPTVPTSVSMRQARLQLLATGNLTIIDAAIAEMGAAASIEWEYATEVRRDNPLVVGIKQLLGWDDTQLDNYFTEASKR